MFTSNNSFPNSLKAILIGLLSISMTGCLLESTNEAPASASELLPQIQQYGQWSSSVIGGGGYVMNIVPTTDPLIYYLYTDVGGFYRSEDGGNNWHMLHGALPSSYANQEPRALVVDPLNPDRFLVACGSHWSAEREGIYLSEDGGKTFQLTLTAAFAGNGNERMWGTVMEVDPNAPNVVIAASMLDGVFRSEDFGKTWTHVGLNGLNPTDLVFDEKNKDRILLCAQPYDFWLLHERHQLNGGLFESTDNGVTWIQIDSVETAPWEIVQVPSSFESDAWVGVFSSSEVKRSTDGGRTWSNYNAGLPYDANARTHDENNVILPEASINPTTFTALSASPEFLLIGAGDGSLYQLHSDSSRWKKVRLNPVATAPDYWYGNPGTKSGWKHFGKAISTVLVDPHTPEKWWMCDWYMLWNSTDAGINWNYAGDGIELTVIHNLTQVPDNPEMIHLGMCDNGYLRSTNAGLSYKQNWNVITSNIKDIAVHPLNNRHVYAIGPKVAGHWLSNHLFHSIDDGVTWVSAAMNGLKSPEERRINSLALDPNNTDTVYICVSGKPSEGGGVFVSVDRGENWESLSEGLSDLELFKWEIWYGGREIALCENGNKVAVSGRESLVYYWNEAEQKWIETAQKFTKPKSVQADPFIPGRFLLTTQSQGLYESTDGGINWRQASLPKGITHYVVFDQAIAGRIAVSTEDGIYLSVDNGATWEVLDKSIPNRRGNPIAFAGNKLVVGSSGCGAFWIPLTETSYQVKAPEIEKTLVWSDEFDGNGAPVGEKWSYETGFVRNKELQYYTENDRDNVRVENGYLVLEARQENYQNALYDANAQPDNWRESRAFSEYTSGSITTKGKASWTYGRIEVCAKIPTGLGTWPAIWMLGDDFPDLLGWPECGEIDIMENVGYDPEIIHGNVHTTDYNHTTGTNKGNKITVSKPWEGFHVYSIDWNSERVQFFVDDVHYHTYYNENTGSSTWPFSKPFFLLLNFAVGGTWGGEQGVDASVFPQKFLIDYVRVYQDPVIAPTP